MKILKALVKDKMSAAEIRADLDRATATLDEAQKAHGESISDYTASLTDEDEEATFRALARRDRAKVVVERAQTLAATLAAALEEAEQRERHDDKVRRYRELEKRAVEIAKALPERYRKIGAETRGLLHDLETVGSQIAALNADLPEGFEPLTPPEALVRHRRSREAEIVSEKHVDWWFYVSSGDPVPEGEWSRIINKSDDGRSGTLSNAAGVGSWNNVVCRPAIVRETIPSATRSWFYPLAATIVLPALHDGTPPEWQGDFRGNVASQIAWLERVREEAAARRAAPPETVTTITPL